MTKKKILKISLLTLAIVGCVSIPVIVYFAIDQKGTNNSTTKKVNLDEQQISYLARVEYIDSISETEASTIKSDIQEKIKVKTKEWNLEENIDYTISDNLAKLKAGDNLKNLFQQITINSINASKKVEGTLIITLNAQENISNRSIEIVIGKNDKESLSALRAKSIQTKITVDATEILTKGQWNEKDKDYKIINLDLIKAGAKFEEYNTKIKIQGISNKLTGEFTVKFVVTNTKAK